MNRYKKLILFICILISTSSLQAQSLLITENGVTINGKSYSKNDFIIETQTFGLNSVTIKIAQITNKAIPNNDFYRRAIIQTMKNKRVVDELYFNDMDPVGSWGGICFNEYQPILNYVIGSKYGDYNGQIIIINKNGKIISKPGGNYFLTADKRFLISDWDSDLSGITIFDFEANKIVFSDKIPVHHTKWYENNGKFYTTEWAKNVETNNIYEFNLNGFTFTKSDLSGDKIRRFKSVTYLDCKPN